MQRIFGGDVGIEFEIANTTGQTLNFQYIPDNFSIVLSNGPSVSSRSGDFNIANTVQTVSDLKNNTTQRFLIYFEMDQPTLNRLKAVADWYQITVHDFAPRLGSAGWRKNIVH
jgi:hypothetical protein